MKNITKTLLVLVSALSISFAATAGELSISGAAKASYVIGGADDAQSKGVGVSNELNATASGEMDNGWTWSYSTELDPADGGAATNDDSQLTITMGDMGTVGFYDSEGGLSKELGYGIKIFHQCIKKQKNSLIDFYNNNKIENKVFEFTDNILKYMLESDIAITRCGASTTAELIYTQTPFIAVPYPHAMDNHQFHNAKYYENKGYCWMIEQTNFNDEVLFNLILKILKDKKKLDSIRENMKKKDIYNTNENIERAVEEFL